MTIIKDSALRQRKIQKARQLGVDTNMDILTVKQLNNLIKLAEAQQA